VRAIAENDLPVQTVVGISTDKACKPVNVMGMTKAIQERVYIDGNLRAPDTRFIAARYGNVLASRGSVVPLFLDQIAAGGPVTITTADMTRFLLTLEDAVDTIFAAVRSAAPGETYIPQCPSAKMTDLAAYLIGEKDIETKITGIRPGEKIHEILLSEEEATRTIAGHEGYYALRPMLPELAGPVDAPALVGDYSSEHALMNPNELATFLETRIPDVVGASYLEA
jgi:UDP-glucose 4-epimerase